MNIIVAADKCFAIGKDNNLLARIPHDMKRFKAITTNNVCVMGKNTYLSIPHRPLPDRKTILVTSKPDLFPEVECHSDINLLLRRIKELEISGEEVFVCGGGQIYRALLPYCEKALVTRINHIFDADATFPNLDNMPEWEKINETDEIETNGYKIRFVDYLNNSPAEYGYSSY